MSLFYFSFYFDMLKIKRQNLIIGSIFVLWVAAITGFLFKKNSFVVNFNIMPMIKKTLEVSYLSW